MGTWHWITPLTYVFTRSWSDWLSWTEQFSENELEQLQRSIEIHFLDFNEMNNKFIGSLQLSIKNND